jgi:cyanobactin maturation PatA/PatG family protease
MEAVRDIPGLEELWRSSGGGQRSVRIAIIDGPVDRGHPSLRDAAIEEVRLDGGAVWSDVRSEHGTHVASIVMGQPGSPVLGVAPSCTAMVSSIYREAPGGQLEPTSQAQVARAINGAVQQGADIINISSGQLTRTGQAERILADAVRRSAEAGALIVAAAGNDGCRCLHVPAALEGVLAVGACDLGGRPLPFSNYGDDYLANGILAPGENVRGAAPGGGLAERTGTSYATPIVSGVVALFLSLLRQRGLSAAPQAVRAALLAGAVPCADDSSSPRCLTGRLDIEGAAKVLLGEGPSPLESPRTRAPPISIRPSNAAAPQDYQQPVPSPLLREGGMPESAGKIPGQASPEAAQPSVTPSGSAAEGDVSVSAADAPASGGADAAPAAAPAQSAVQPAAQQAAPSAAMQGSAMPHAMGPSMMVMPMPMPWMGQPAVMPQGGYQIAPNGLVMPAAPQGTPAPAMPAQAPLARGEAAAFTPSAGSCECGMVRPSQGYTANGELVFVIGRLFYDFGTEARQDYFYHEIRAWRESLRDRGDPAFGPERDQAGDIAAPLNPEIMARFLLDIAPGEQTARFTNLPMANALIWTLTIDNIPIYALDPRSVFGSEVFRSYVLNLWYQEVTPIDPWRVDEIVTARKEAVPLRGWPRGEFERLSQAGEVVGTTTLQNGTVVPTLAPAWRGTYTWRIRDLLGLPPDTEFTQEWLNENPWAVDFRAFLERIYNEFRNTGVSPQDRALNYSAMNARYTKEIFEEMTPGPQTGEEGAEQRGLMLDTVEIDRSTVCRPESDCWDVTYRFFDPMNVLTQAREVFQYTIDVSDVVPVPVGPLKRWRVA